MQLSRDDLRPEYNVVFDRDRLSYYGMNSATASQAVRNRIDGLVASKYREDGDEYDIVVRYASRSAPRSMTWRTSRFTTGRGAP